LLSVADAPTPEPDSFWDAVLAGLVGFGAFFTGLFFALGYALPWLALVVVISAAILLARRRRRRARTAADNSERESAVEPTSKNSKK
jgi:predicted lipid-binding transport protein (Tim44 family)